MFEDRQKIIIASLLGVAALVAIFLLWLLLRPKEAPINLTQSTTSTVQTGGSNVEPVILEPASQTRLENEKKYPLGSKQVAMAFAERYSSYSTDEPIKNIQDLKFLTTPDFYSVIISESQTREGSGTFYGYSAKALSANLIDSSQSSANIAVSLQIQQIVGDGENGNVLYRTLNVNLVKTGDEWKVSKASWQ